MSRELLTQVQRQTRETHVTVRLGDCPTRIEVAVPFFGHLLEACATTWGMGLDVFAAGDVAVDPHHLIEDVGLVLGRALAERWPGYGGIARYGWAVVPMDEARVTVALDMSGRPGWQVEGMPDGPVGGVESEALTEFWTGLARGGRLTVHVTRDAGRNRHHQWEAAFKALGLALRQAVAPRAGVLSSKGVVDDGGGHRGSGGRQPEFGPVGPGAPGHAGDGDGGSVGD
jgi:imidazoleglycerol-phosphate dehydratase